MAVVATYKIEAPSSQINLMSKFQMTLPDGPKEEKIERNLKWLITFMSLVSSSSFEGPWKSHQNSWKVKVKVRKRKNLFKSCPQKGSLFLDLKRFFLSSYYLLFIEFLLGLVMKDIANYGFLSLSRNERALWKGSHLINSGTIDWLLILLWPLAQGTPQKPEHFSFIFLSIGLQTKERER